MEALFNLKCYKLWKTFEDDSTYSKTSTREPQQLKLNFLKLNCGGYYKNNIILIIINEYKRYDLEFILEKLSIATGFLNSLIQVACLQTKLHLREMR